MIARHARGAATGVTQAVAVRVVEANEGGALAEDESGATFRLARGAADGSSAGLYGLDRQPFAAGDIAVLDPKGHAELIYRPTWVHNSVLVTQRCDSLCVMCSQPPRDIDDSARIDVLIAATRLLPASTRSVGLTGGEPSLLGHRLVDLVRALRDAAPGAGVHLLSNGRGFRDAALAAALGAVRHPDLMVGIPVYADYDDLHDKVVGRVGAFEETLWGLEHLARAGVALEIRVVLHRSTIPRLVATARFLARNVPYAAQVALMGLEPTGYAVANLAALWVDPVDYADELGEAVALLAARGMRPRIYNLQRCVLPRSLWPFAVRSISEWKNEYLPACEGCSEREACCGFFSSAVSRRVVSRSIRARGAG